MEETETKKTTYFGYDEQGFFTEPVEAEEQPENTCKWDPRPIPQGKVALHVEGSWHHVPNYEIPENLERYVSEIKRKLKNLSFPTKYSPLERATFDIQIQEATKFLDSGIESAILTKIATARGEDEQTVALKIRAKHDAEVNQKITYLCEIQGINELVSVAESYDDWKAIETMIDNLMK